MNWRLNSGVRTSRDASTGRSLYIASALCLHAGRGRCHHQKVVWHTSVQRERADGDCARGSSSSLRPSRSVRCAFGWRRCTRRWTGAASGARRGTMPYLRSTALPRSRPSCRSGAVVRGARRRGGGCVGGNTCGLWIFFHVTLANLDRISAAPALRAIGAWVGAFFGCAPSACDTLDSFTRRTTARTRPATSSRRSVAVARPQRGQPAAARERCGRCVV